MRKYLKLILFIVLGFLFLFSLRLGLTFKYLRKGDIPYEEYWVKQVYLCKHEIARRLEEVSTPRIIIISGSNSMFGINNKTLEELTGCPVINMATHAGLPLEYLMFEANKHIRKGDIVVLPLEYNYYWREPNEKWQIDNLFAWGKDFLRNAHWGEKISYIWRVPTSFFINEVTKPHLSKNEKALTDNWCKFLNYPYSRIRFSQFGVYGLGRMKSDGTVVSGNQNLFTKDIDYRLDYRSENLEKIAYYKKMVEGKGATFVLTYPVMMDNSLFKTRSPQIQEQLKRFIEALRYHGLFLSCSFESAVFSRKDMHDSEYHLTSQGADIRTRRLGACLCERYNLQGTKKEILDYYLELKNGFHSAENWGVWSKGKEAVIKLILGHKMMLGNLIMNFDVMAFVNEKNPDMKVTIYANNHYLAEWSFQYGSKNPLTRLEVPFSWLKNGRFLEMKFKVDNPASPQSLGLGNDARILGVGFKSVDIEQQ